jgi:histidinol-phosphate/aromatic aminotransferase/cobyric acid decarboxylase-like protein
MITPNINPSWSPRKEIKYIKEALKKDHLYTDDEIRHLKSRLRDMYIVCKQLNKGNGFG